MIPKDHASILYSWIMNFKFFDAAVKEFYNDSVEIPEGDIYIYSDPDYVVPGHPGGLAIFDPAHNCAMILGMRYFGEHKKGYPNIGMVLGKIASAMWHVTVV